MLVSVVGFVCDSAGAYVSSGHCERIGEFASYGEAVYVEGG